MAFEDGDTVASALYRHGVRTFTRSLKYHRRRGLYCGTGDCPNCLIRVDGVPAVRSCTTPVAEGMQVEREDGWPSTEFDLISVTDKLHAFMPVGFYYKTFVRPRFAWEAAEKVIRRATGLGRLPDGAAADRDRCASCPRRRAGDRRRHRGSRRGPRSRRPRRDGAGRRRGDDRRRDRAGPDARASASP